VDKESVKKNRLGMKTQMQEGHVYLIQKRFWHGYSDPIAYRCLDVSDTCYLLAKHIHDGEMGEHSKEVFWVTKSECRFDNGWFKSKPYYKILEQL
jgi:hypothetical protein